MAEQINIKVENIRNVEIKSKVVTSKDQPPKIITAVRFEYEGEPSEMENLLMLETQGQHINATFDTPQMSFELDKGKATAGFS